MRAVMGSMVLLLGWAASGCKSTCEADTCPSGTYCDGTACVAECNVNEDCASHICDPAETCCASAPFCSVEGRCVVEAIPVEECVGQPTFPPDGWDDVAGTGRVFVVNSILIGGPNEGTNIDGKCNARGCADNELAIIGEFVNDWLRQSLLGGDSLTIVEIAGITPRFRGYDRSVTIKIYSALDFDDPYFPANNFKVPPGHSTCCEFVGARAALSENGAPLARIPARIEAGRITTTEPTGFPLVYTGCRPPDYPVLEFKRATVRGQLSADGGRLEALELSAVLPINNLASLGNPACRWFEDDDIDDRIQCHADRGATLHDFILRAAELQADIDLDGDGRECVYDLDGDDIIDTCCDGVGDEFCAAGTDPCVTGQVPPLDPTDPASCRRSPRMADGLSVTFKLSAVAATLRASRAE